MNHPFPTHTLLPLALPEERMQRLTLIALRRMAAHGIHDAQAALILFNHFGINFRKPLVLLRAFIAELSQCSARNITIAPCCAMRMTTDEGRMVGVLATAATNPRIAARHLRLLANSSAISAPLSTAAAFSEALADLGQPLVI